MSEKFWALTSVEEVAAASFDVSTAAADLAVCRSNSSFLQASQLRICRLFSGAEADAGEWRAEKNPDSEAVFRSDITVPSGPYVVT